MSADGAESLSSDGAESLSSDLVSRSVNYHGHTLLKQLTTAYPKDIASLNLKDVDYKVYKARIPEVRWVLG